MSPRLGVLSSQTKAFRTLTQREAADVTGWELWGMAQTSLAVALGAV